MIGFKIVFLSAFARVLRVCQFSCVLKLSAVCFSVLQPVPEAQKLSAMLFIQDIIMG